MESHRGRAEKRNREENFMGIIATRSHDTKRGTSETCILFLGCLYGATRAHGMWKLGWIYGGTDVELFVINVKYRSGSRARRLPIVYYL